MPGAFKDYSSKFEKKIYADHAAQCRRNGKSCHWSEDGTYIHHWDHHTYEQDIWDKTDRETEVFSEWKELNRKRMVRERMENIQRDIDMARNEKRNNDAARNKQREIDVARNEQQRNEQRAIDAAKEFLASKGIHVL